MRLLRSQAYPSIVTLALLSALPSAAYDFSAVDKLLEDSLVAYGDSVSVVIRQEDKVIYHKSLGKLDTTVKIGIASASKWISGAIILRLAEKKLFKLDDTLGAYLPAFTAHGKGSITIRQCFSMTSGLYGGRNYDLLPLYTLQRSVDSIAEYTPLDFIPGTAFAYSGSGMQSVARIAEIVTNKPWSQVAKEEILDPCGMTNTTYDNFGSLNPAVAGGIQTSTSDYMRFLGMVMAGGRSGGVQVLSQASLAEMFVDQTGGVPILSSPWPGSPESYPDGKPPGYGFGCWAMSTNPATGKEDEISSPGAYGSFPWADRCRNLYGMVLVHNLLEAKRSHTVTLQLIALVRKEVGGCATVGMNPISPQQGIRATRSQGFRLEGSSVPSFFGKMNSHDKSLRSADGRLLFRSQQVDD